MFKLQYILIILITFFTLSLYSIEDNYKELKKVEKKLKYNKEILIELKNIEKELDFDIRKVDRSLKKYKYMIKKGFNEKNKIKGLINKEKKEVELVEKEINIFKKAQSTLLSEILLDTILADKQEISSIIRNNIYMNIVVSNRLKKQKKDALNLSIVDKESSLNKINTSLAKIRKQVDFDAVKKERILGETLITAIQKEKNKYEQKIIKDRANTLKELIEKLKRSKVSNLEKSNISLGKFEDMLPVGKLSIQKINTKKLETGILLILKKDSILKSPREALVVYADSFKGYGNMVILDLGNDFHLIFSGLSNILCKTGDWVQKGVVLGDINKNVRDNTLYMEVRFKGKTINPSKWLRS